MADKVKQLEQYFNRATNETTVHPDTQLLVEICNVINSRADMYSPFIFLFPLKYQAQTRCCHSS